jgi:hypothetical protein
MPVFAAGKGVEVWRGTAAEVPAEPARGQGVDKPGFTEVAALDEHKPATRDTLARDITLQIAGADRRPVEVRLHEQNGRVQVEVRTSDTDTAKALRSDLADLARAVEQRGYQIDTWTPSDTYPRSVLETSQPSQNGPDSQDNGHHGGNANGGAHSQRDDREKHSNDPEWLVELQRKLSGEED